MQTRRIAAMIMVVLAVLIMVLATSYVIAGPPVEEGTLGMQVPAGASFTYQGRLTDGGNPANGSYDFEFKLYDAAGGGSQVGSVTADDVTVTDGLFTVELDFGSDVFKGDARYLEIGVRPGSSSGGYTTLSPRQALAPAPYALALPGLWTQQNATSPNIIGGNSGNTVTGGVVGATIGGGGQSGYTNSVTDDYGTVGGGRSNTASGLFATVGGGFNNTSGFRATVGGGVDNTANNDSATVSGGYGNRANGEEATIAGGVFNTASGDSATVGGGDHNEASGGGATIGGGYLNHADALTVTIGGGEYISVTGRAATVAGGSYITVTGEYAAVGGGVQNAVSGAVATVGGGGLNTASGDGATIGGGSGNVVTATLATVGGGADNTASGYGATIGGGWDNTANSTYATVGGGVGNVVTDTLAAVGGGADNTASNVIATIGGGGGNTASGYAATVGGGNGNTAPGDYATVPGGSVNTAQGNYSFAAGRRAKAIHDGTFVWADATDADFESTETNQFSVRATNGADFLSDNTASGFLVENKGDGDGIRAFANVSRGTSWAAVYAVNNGTSPAVYADTDGTYSGYFLDDVYVEGSCVGCVIVYIGLNDGSEPLEAGDLVSVSGVSSPLAGTETPVLRVRRAAAGRAVIGVVQSKADVVKSSKDGELLESANRVEEAAARGDYVFIVVQGLAYVKANSEADAITAGQRLTVADQPGHVRALRTRTLEGMVVTEGSPVIGIALAPLDKDSGMIPVFVTLR